MKERYAPTSNKVQNHYKFHRLNQQIAETFDDFTYQVKAEAKLCEFKCDSETCTVQDTLIRDQLIVGTSKEAIREEALKNQWDLINKGCTIESSVAAASEIKQEHTIPINRAAAGVYSKRHRKDKRHIEKEKKFICWKCEKSTCAGYDKCKFHNKECPNCRKYGHSVKSRLCKGGSESRKTKQNKRTNRTEIDLSTPESSSTEGSSDTTQSDDDDENSSYNSENETTKIPKRKTRNKLRQLSILAVALEKSKTSDKYRISKIGGRRGKKYKKSFTKVHRMKGDYHTVVNINGVDVEVLVDTGADINVISLQEASSLGLQWKKSKVKLRPYGSKPLKVCGKYNGPVTFSNNSIETDIFIVKKHLETLISGNTAEKLGIISFNTVNSIETQ